MNLLLWVSTSTKLIKLMFRFVVIKSSPMGFEAHKLDIDFEFYQSGPINDSKIMGIK